MIYVYLRSKVITKQALQVQLSNEQRKSKTKTYPQQYRRAQEGGEKGAKQKNGN